MSEFSAYEKMPNSLKKLGLSESDYSSLEKLKWVVTEKVHGANFSFIYEEGRLKYAKRKEYLSWKDDFFGFQLVVNQIENKIISLFEQLSIDISASKYIVYGELFGGKYPHPEIEPNPNLQAIQTGVYYTPNIHFLAFDIAIESSETSSKYYMDYEGAVSYFEGFDLLYAKPLFIGKFSEAMNFDIRIDSAVPNQMGMPDLPNNLIEGVVIKPWDQKSKQEAAKRPIIKLKNPEFDEEDKFHQAEKWSFIPGVNSKSEDLGYILDELKNYVTQNRLQSAISKIGTLDLTDKSRVVAIKAEVLQDVMTDFNENNDQLLNELSSEEQNWLSERVIAEINKIVESWDSR